LHCGMIFIGYRSVRGNSNSTKNSIISAAEHTRGSLHWLSRIFFWMALVSLIVVLFLILRPSTPLQIAVNPEATKHAEAKIEKFQSAIGQGNEYRLEMNESELNGWLIENLGLKQPASMKSVSPRTSGSLEDVEKIAIGSQSFSPEDLEQLQSSVHDVKIELLDEALRVYALLDIHGVGLWLELEGKPVVRNGYIRLEPSAGKLGSLPMMGGTLKSITNHLFDSPQNKEKFKLPPDIKAVRIEQGQLIVIAR
jgi:hypothetical protein